MAAWQLDLAGISQELRQILLEGKLTQDLHLEFITPTGARRTMSALYRLMRENSRLGAFKISYSKNDPCKLILKPGSVKKFQSAAFPEGRGHGFSPGHVREEVDYIKLLTTDEEELTKPLEEDDDKTVER